MAAQDRPAWPNSPANCKVDGQVLDAITGRPVAGAVVTMYNKHARRWIYVLGADKQTYLRTPYKPFRRAGTTYVAQSGTGIQ